MRVLLLAALLVTTQAVPVIIVPGLFGTRLDWNLQSHKGMAARCKFTRLHKWSEAWLDETYAALNIPCLNAGLSLSCSTEIDMYGAPVCKPTHDVAVRAPQYGHVSPSAKIISPKGKVSYMGRVAAHLQKKGYIEGQNLFLAGYDWRMAPAFAQDIARLKTLIAHAVAVNGEPVLLFGHSLGCSLISVFLQHMSASWKQAHVRSVLYVAPPFAGSAKAVAAETVGFALGPLGLGSDALKMANGWPVVPYMAARASVYHDAPILELSGTTYTASDIEALVAERHGIERGRLYEMLQALADELENDTGVHTIAILGRGEKTPVAFQKKHKKVTPLSSEDGDGFFSLRHSIDALPPKTIVRECSGGHYELITSGSLSCVTETLDELIRTV